MKRNFWFYSMGLVLLLSGFASLTVSQNKIDTAPALDFDEPGEEETLNRELWETVKKTPYETALERIRQAQQSGAERPFQATAMLPNGWKISPAGEQAEVGRLPFEAVAFAGQIVVLNTGYYNQEPQEVSVVNPNTRRTVKILRFAGLYPSAVIGGDNDLYISGGFSQKIFRLNKNFETVSEYPLQDYTAGLAALDGEHLAVVSLVTAENAENFDKGNYRRGKLAVLNTETGKVERETDIGYFPQAVAYLNGKLYVTILGENKLQIFDAELKSLGTLQIGAKPQNICTSGNRLYVVNTSSDNLSVVDTQTDKVVSTISVAWKDSRFGSAPTSCAVDDRRIYVTQADTNAVAVLDLKGAPLGYIPAAWYPTKVFFQNNQMFVLSAKGTRPLRPNVDGTQPVAGKGGSQYVLTLLKGSLAVIDKSAIRAKLAAWTRQVEAGTPFFNSSRGLKIPIKHIFYIVRENRTYDQVLGDLPRGNGDAFLTLFGREVTPNAHLFSEEFVTLDNYYADGEISVLGHSFTTSGYASPFLEWLGNNAYAGRFTGYPFGTVPAATSPAYLWDALDEKKINYRIYGENYFLYTRAYRILRETFGADAEITQKFYAQMMSYAAKVDRGNSFYQLAKPFYGQADTPANAFKLLDNPEFAREFSIFLCGDESILQPLRENSSFRARFAEYLAHYPSNYRSWDLNVSDLERAAAWRDDFEKQIARGNVAQLNYLWLPNDHTGGADKRYLPPDQLVAQNDAALGLIVNTISKSPLWKNSLILVTEDDAQNGPDHVDATRTVALVVSPFVKRNAVVSERYDQLSLLRTIEFFLGLPPLNLNDALAVPMFGVFTDKPDFRPVSEIKSSTHLNDVDRRLYQNFSMAQ